MAKSSPNPESSQETALIEWIFGIISACLVLAMIGWVGWQALSSTGGKPLLSIEILNQTKQGPSFEVEFLIKNDGPMAAAGVTVQGELTANGQSLETREVVFDYVPAHSEMDGVLLFKNDPKTSEMDIRASGYTDP